MYFKKQKCCWFLVTDDVKYYHKTIIQNHEKVKLATMFDIKSWMVENK